MLRRIVTAKTSKNIMNCLQFVCINTQLQLHCKKNNKKQPKNILSQDGLVAISNCLMLARQILTRWSLRTHGDEMEGKNIFLIF